RAAGKVLRATPITAPGERAARVSAAAAHAAAADALTIITRAAAGERHAEHRATLMFAPLPASTLEVIAPAEPWSAGAPIELAATARDELGRAVATEVSVMALPPHDDLVIDAGDAAHVRLRAPTNIDSALTLEVRATTAATTRRTFRLVAAEPATVRLERAGDHGFMLAVDDAFGNPSPGVTPTLVAGSGEVEALVETAPGRWQGVWVPAIADQREETRLNASLPTSSAETVMRHYGSAWAVQVSGYGGALVGRGSLLGVGGLVLVEARLPKLPSRLSIDAAAGGWYAAREQTAEPGLAATRRAALVPLGLGVSWEMPLAIGWRCDVGVMGGVLLTSTSTTVRENGVTVAGPRSLKGSTAQLTPWVRVGRQAGPGLVAVLVSGLIALGGVSTWTEPPLVASLALGYAWEP
ncbi:MAG TPA: hypothetical protein VLC93_02845, partial [Myxococcota bacterium]|nr:hypothetical protein [Myxococcota bacterium]